MAEAAYNIRLATLEDAEKLRQSVRCTLSSPEGKGQRKQYREGVERREILVLEHYDAKERTRKLEGFLEWHTRLDGTVTIRDAGCTGEEVRPGIIKRLVRELLHLYSPPLVRAKTRADQALWTSIFQELPGFRPEGREYTRTYWFILWSWEGDVVRERRPRPGGERRGRR